MNILFIGHDLTYVQFYKALENALRQHTTVTAKHVYFRPSAFLYAKYGLRLRALSPCLIRLAGRWPAVDQDQNAGPDLRFYQPDATTEMSARFTSLYAAYLEFFRRRTNAGPFEVAILPGEFRLFEQAAIRVLKAAPRPPILVYFEAGPPGYIYFDLSGVNANASFAKTGRSQMLADTGIPYAAAALCGEAKVPKALRIGLLAFDVAWLWLAKISRGLLDLEEYWVAMGNRLRRQCPSVGHKVAEQAIPEPSSRFVVFLGQVRNDINHTHFGLTESELERCLTGLLASDPTLHLSWRDHPLEDSEELFHRICMAFPGRVARAAKGPLQHALGSSEGVITVNSNGGLEALVAGLPVRLLGRSYFAGLAGVCTDDESFRALRQRVRECGPDPGIRADAERFLQTCFLPINYRGEEFCNAAMAAQVIMRVAS
jgi:capsule polysaccharide modification protein KpsS